MKIVSQNTTALSSATAPGNNQPQLVATPVPDEQRISFWPQHFGLIPQWVTLEPRVFGWMDRLTVHYYRLRDYALQHPECSAIMRIID
ncbi:antirestriction protein [Escherichia coli]|uniref:antirestriction protein n=1 Tax=Escherichia coli TaxID=562 RepID=UPI001F4B0C7F|nr:antirestriction protein [Escherichia coli]